MTLTQLMKRGLIECINPEAHKGRLDRITDIGHEVVQEGLRPSVYYGAFTRLNIYTTVITAPGYYTAYVLMSCQTSKCLDETFV